MPLLARNPAVKARPPTAREADAKAPEMHPWNAGQLRRFLDWARDHSQLYAAWYVSAYTGMRRGELLALRWRDIDLDAGTISVRRSVGIVRVKGRKGILREGPTKTCKPRVIDIDPATVAVLRAWKRERGALALALARDDSVVFGNQEGQFRQPERFSHLFREQQARCARMLGEDAPPGIRLHDLRHSRRRPVSRPRERQGRQRTARPCQRDGHAECRTLTCCRATSGRRRPVSRPWWRGRTHEQAVGAWYHRRIQLPFSVRMTPRPAAQREATGSRHRTVSTVTIL